MTPGRVCAASLAALGFTSWASLRRSVCSCSSSGPPPRQLLAAYATAGRHPGKYGEDADRFDVARADEEHLAFGHGVHFCLGATLGRLEARIALQALFDSGSRPGAFVSLNCARPGR